MDRRSVLTMTTALGAGGAALHASELLAQQKQPAAGGRSSFIQRTDGTTLYFKDWGTGSPVVFVNSAGLTSDMWGYQMVPLTARGMRCVAFDRRGHGKSSDPGRGYDFDTLADDLAAVIETLDLRNVTLIGHSMGCGEITRYLTRHGSSRITRVSLLSPTTPFLLKTPDNPQGIDRSAFQALRATWLKDHPKWMADNTDSFFVPGTSEAMKRWANSVIYTTSLQVQLACNVVAVTETDFRQELPRIKVPVLIIHGTQDVSAPLELTGARTAKLIPGCRLEVYEGAPHGLFITHMERVNEDLSKFIRA